jgi:hypothetical protein
MIGAVIAAVGVGKANPVNASQHRLTLDRLSLTSPGIRVYRLACGLIIHAVALAECATVGPLCAIGVAILDCGDVA